MPTLKLRVKGLTPGDETRLERALREVEGVLFASVCRGAHSADVEFEDDRVTADEIRDVVRGAGFDAEAAG